MSDTSATDNLVEVVEQRGDTIDPPPEQKCIKKRCSASKFWEGCAYNYEESWMVELVEVFNESKVWWTFGEEVGTKKGTPHLQIAVHSTKYFRPMEKFKLSFNVSWVKGRKDGADAGHWYARKDEVFQSNYSPKKPPIDVTEPDVMALEDLPQWGQDLVAHVDGRLPDKKDRSIYWFYSTEGQMHKTETARYLCHHHDAVVIQGGRKHALANAYKNPAPIYVILIPRCDEGYVSYGSMELLKDALYMSAFGTECTGMVNRKKPWVIIMANFPHSRRNCDMSLDRWQEKCVDKPKKVPKTSDEMLDFWTKRQIGSESSSLESE